MVAASVQVQAYNWGRFITREEWDRLTAKQREEITLDLETRSLMLIPGLMGDGFLVGKSKPDPAEEFAELIEGQFIPRTKWDALTTEEKSRAKKLLAVRGLFPHEKWNELREVDSMTLIPLSLRGQPVEYVLTNPNAYQFTVAVDDGRLSENVEIHIVNQGSEREAIETLRNWMQAVGKLALCVSDESEVEEPAELEAVAA